MSIPLMINGTVYEYPVSGTSPNWGQEATEWAKAVTDLLSSISGEGDINPTSFPIDNNKSIFSEINGLLFDSAITRSAQVSYSIYRTSQANASGNAEVGTISLIYDDSAVSGSKWILSQQTNGNAGVIFSVDDNGQFFYKSNDIGSTDYVGTIKFSAKVLNK